MYTWLSGIVELLHSTNMKFQVRGPNILIRGSSSVELQEPLSLYGSCNSTDEDHQIKMPGPLT